jgi:hypothetical protein
VNLTLKNTEMESLKLIITGGKPLALRYYMAFPKHLLLDLLMSTEIYFTRRVKNAPYN